MKKICWFLLILAIITTFCLGVVKARTEELMKRCSFEPLEKLNAGSFEPLEPLSPVFKKPKKAKEVKKIIEVKKKDITGNDYYKLASIYGKEMNIRPAFLLAVIQQESRLGQDMGNGKWRKNMHPEHKSAFLQICKKLRKNPDDVLVSQKPWYGWGGAMGPAQIMPATWLDIEEEIIKLTGHKAPNPWNPVDALAGASIILARAGACQQTYQTEHIAALRYFAGNNWYAWKYQWYGWQVMAKAGK